MLMPNNMLISTNCTTVATVRIVLASDSITQRITT